jgi:hypothetical protein
VESSAGNYPSTEGFLLLLSVLFAAGGSPADLGQEWRNRSGCTPYVEYVIDFVIPRIAGNFEKLPALPFRSRTDKDRLACVALKVVETVLITYAVCEPIRHTASSPDKAKESILSKCRNAALIKLGHESLALSLTQEPFPEDLISQCDDFGATMPQSEIAQTVNYQLNFKSNPGSQQSGVNMAIPRGSTPGFAVIARLLAANDGVLFTAMCNLIVFSGMNSSKEILGSKLAAAVALYGSTPPSYQTAKDGAQRHIPSHEQQRLLKPLLPESFTHDVFERLWRDRLLQSALRIICATIAREDMFQTSWSNSRICSKLVPYLRFHLKVIVPATIELRFSSIARWLVSSNSANGALSSISRALAFFSHDEIVDSSIATAAAATIFYIEASGEETQQVAALLCERETMGEETILGNALAQRLTACKRRLSSDVELLRFVLGRLLVNLREKRTSGLLEAVLGSSGLHTGIERISHVTRNDCLASILGLVSTVDFVFGADSADVAASCYEVVYRLIEVGRLAISNSLQTSSALRMERFWNSHLVRVLSGMSPAMDQKTSHYAIHSVSWLLKGMANELHLLAGLSNGLGDNPDVLGAPQPVSYMSLCRSLFSEGGIFFHALAALPIEQPAIFDRIVVADDKAVGAAKEPVLGAPEVVEGYAMLNPVKLEQALKLDASSTEDVRLWVAHWNLHVTRDCASAHLSDAIHSLIGSFACSYNTVSSTGHQDGFSKEKLLTLILNRMSFIGATSSSHVLEASLFTSACRNLAAAVLDLSHLIFSQDEEVASSNVVERASARNLLIKAIGFSYWHRQAGNNYPRRKELVFFLCQSLLLAMRTGVRDPNDFDHTFVVLAAEVLSSLAIDVSTNAFPASPSRYAIIARRGLSLLLEILDSRCREVLTQPLDTSARKDNSSLTETILRLLPSMEDDVAYFIQDAASHQGIPGLFFEAGIGEALHQAAVMYKKEEERLIESQSRTASYGEIILLTPPFLLGHLDLMSIMMSLDIARNVREDLALKFLTILQTYASVLQRLKLPEDGNVLLSVVRCLSQIRLLVPDRETQKNVVAIGLRESQSHGDLFGMLAFLRKVASTAVHIAEHPLPRQFLCDIPSRLHNKKKSSPHLVFSVSEPQISWWGSMHDGRGLDAEICTTAVAALDIACNGLALVRSFRLQSATLSFALLRALYQCIGTLKVREMHHVALDDEFRLTH